MPRTKALLDTYSPFFAELKDYIHLVRELNTVLPEIFNVDGKERSIRLTDINYDMPADTRDYAKQLQARLTDSDYSMPIRGTFKVLDSQGKVIDTMKNKLLLRLPLPTGRATFILRGNEMVLAKQQRLRPGVYTTKGVGGVQAFINSQTRQNMKIRLDPEKLSFSFEIGGKKLPLYPILKAMGVSDKKLLRMWGKDVYQKNYRSDRHTQRVIDKLYDTMLKYTGTAKGPHERADQVKQAFQDTEIDPWTSELTLGRAFNKITPDVLTEATKKMIGVSSGTVKPDKTDALYFQDAYGFDDLILYGLNKQKKSIRWKLENRLNRSQYTHIDALARPLADVRDLVYKKFTQADLTRNPEQINPIGMFADASEITQMGEGAIGSTFSITHGMRGLDDSSMGFVDPVHTPASDKVGVNTHLTLNTIKDGRKLKTALFDMRKNMANPTKATLSSRDAFDKYVAIPGEFKKDESGKFLPAHRRVRVVHRGEIKKVEPARVDFYLGSPTNIMDIDTALIPFLSTNTPTRTSMALKQITHTLPLENREAPLVQSGVDGISTEHHMYNLMNRRVPSYIKSGEVTAVDEDYIQIKDQVGKLHKISIYNKFPLNGHVELHETPTVQVGAKVKSGGVIAENNFSKDSAIALGANLRMAYMPYKGLNWKDALVISESAAKKMAAVRVDNISHDVQKHDILSKKTFRTQYPMAYTGAQMDTLDDDGVIQEGMVVRHGDPLILKMKPRELTEDDILRGNVSKALSNQLTRDEKEWDSEHDGVVERVVKTPRGIKVYVKSIRPIRRGDKISSRHQSKGIVASIIPDDKMPRDADGNIFDILQNPAAVPSRINPGQIAELLASKIAKKTGVPYRAPLFVDKNDVFRKVNEDAVSHGVTDREAVYDADGKPFMQLGKPAQVLTGYQYVLRQKQEAEPYFQARNREDPFDMVSHRPVKGPKVGPLGFYALLAHGADDILKDFATHGGELNDEYWRAVEMGHAIPSPKTPFALKKLKALLAGAGMQMRKEGDDYRLLPLTDKETLRMSAGVVEAPDQSIRIGKPGKYDLITPFKNGLYGDEVFGGLQGDRWGHIDLTEPVPNPIFEEPIRYVLGLSQAQYNGLVHGSMHLQDGEVVEGSGGLTGGSAFAALLDRVDVNSEVDKLRKDIPNHVGSAKSKLIRRGRYLSGLQKTKLSAKDAYLISKVPVLPPQFRPVYLTREGAIRVSDFTQLYRDIGMMNTTLQEASGLPSSMRGELRTGLYDALKALQIGSTGYGFGSEERKGILQFLKGPSPSKGHFQDKIFSRRQSVGGRAVIMPNPSLGIDEVGIPEDMAWHTMKSWTMRRLAKQGIKPLDARRMVESRTRQASDALNAVLKHRLVFLSRDPKLHKHNILAFYAHRIPGKSLELSPLVYRGFNADNDGDQMNMYVPGSEAAIDEARKRMLPSRNLFKAGKDNVIMSPEEDTIAGLYFATKFSRPTDSVFASEAKALRAFNNKEVESTDIVMVDGQKRSIAQILINNALPEKLRDYSRVLDNKALMGVLNKVGKQYPNRYVTVVEKLNDLGNDFGYRAALSFSFKDFMSVPSPELKNLDPAMAGLPADVQEKVTRRLRDSIAPTSMLALLADSGAKGSWNKVQQLKYSPVVTKDFNGIVPHVIQRAYTHGLDLMDWWTASKGNRPALHSKSVEVREPGYFSKQLLRSCLGLTIAPGDETSGEGLTYPVNHPTVVSRYLAQAVRSKAGKIIGRAGDPITEDLVNSAKAAGIKEFVVRSPLTSTARKGFYAKDFGRDAGGQKPLVGDDVGIISAHTLSEPAVQLTLKAFHDAGSATADNRIEGLYAIWPLLNGRAPAGHQATLSPYAGKIQSTVKLPTGGWKVMLENGESFNTPTVKKLWFQRGDKITRGEQIHEGYPDPGELLEYKGLRNMQMYLVDQMEKNYGKNAPDRRYLETVVAALTQYGEVKDPGGHQEFMPGDIITLREAEQYNKDLDKGTAPIQVSPTYVGMDQALVKHEPDWAVKMMGRDMIRQLQMSAATGALSSLESPSPIMPYIHGQDFGYNLHRTGEY